jgi:hypothetical protein
MINHGLFTFRICKIRFLGIPEMGCQVIRPLAELESYDLVHRERRESYCAQISLATSIAWLR